MRFDLFSSGRLYKALEDAGYPDLPAKRTLQDWIKNDSAPKSARLAVAEILGIQKEPPGPPEWAEGLANTVADRVIASLLTPDRLAAVDALVAELESRLPQPTEVPHERTDTEGPGGGLREGPRAGSPRAQD